MTLVTIDCTAITIGSVCGAVENITGTGNDVHTKG